MANQLSLFGQVAATLAGALVVLTACNMTTPATVKPGATGASPPDVGFTSSGTTASLAFNLSLSTTASKRQLLSLPSDTGSVDITITGAAFGGKTVSATVHKADFINGQASITLDNLPLGSATVGVIVYDNAHNQLGHGTATATVEAGKINPVRITVQAAAATGGLNIMVDSVVQPGSGFASLPVLSNTRIDRLAIPSLVLVFYGYNGFSRGVLGDPAPQPPSSIPPAAVAPLDLLNQVQTGVIKDPTKTAIQAGYDGMDAYNAQDPADDRAKTAPHYVAALKAIFGRTDADANAIAQALTPDVQTLDMSQATKFPTSGRMLTDDVVDTELQLLSGAAGATDKIGANDKDFTTSFPYLAHPW